MLIITNFIVIALALFMALLVAASAAKVRGQQHGDDLPNSEWRTTTGPDTAEAADQPAAVNLRQLPVRRIAVLGLPLKPEQEPCLVKDEVRKRA